MSTIAELGLSINSDPAAQAAEDLDQLVRSGEKAEKAVDALSGSTKQAEERLLALARAAVQSSTYQETLNRAYEATSGASAAAARAQLDLSASQSRVSQSSSEAAGVQDRLSASGKKLSSSSADQAQALEKLLGKIDPTIAAFARLDAQQEQLAKFKAAGILPADDFARFNSQIETTRQKLGGFDDSMRKTGVSAGQTKAALNQLPAQFTDIFTSLAGGQSPMLVLIQQGGQIKDSFGGIGPLFDTLGHKIGSLFGLSGGVSAAGAALGDVASSAKSAGDGAEAAGAGLGSMAEGANTAADAAKNAKEASDALSASAPPLASAMGLVIGGILAAAAAMVGLVVAYKQGSQEGSEYTKALTLTGNTAGVTSGRLSDLAVAVAAVNGTVGEAAVSLASLAGSANIPSEAFQMVATSAANMEDATGKATSATIANFEKIAKDPLKATLELNESMNFLTVSTYEQIVALEKKGEKQAAATVGMKAYADAINDRSADIVQKLGFWERGWKAISDETKNTIDAFRAVGREMGDAEKILDLQRKVAYAQSALKADPDDTDNAEALSNAKLELSYLIQQKDTRDAIAAASGAYAEREKEGISAQEFLNAKYVAGLDKQAKKKLEIEELDRNRAKALKADGVNADEVNRKYDVALSGINEKYKEQKKERAYTEAAGIRELDQAKQQYAVLKEQLALVGLQKGEVDKLGESGKALIKWEQQLADLKEKKTLTADQKSLLANQELITAQLKRNAALEKEIALKKLSADEDEKLIAYQKALAAELELSKEGLSNQLAGLGMGSEGRKRLQDDLKLRQDYQKKMNSLQEQLNKGEITSELYEKETAALQSALDQRLSMQTDYYRQLEMAQADWSNGANAAWQDYVDEAGDIAGQTYDLFSNAFHGMEDTLVDFVTTGKLSFKDLADSIIADIARILIRTKIVTPALNALFGGGGASGGVSSLLGGGGASGSGFNLESAWNGISGAYSVATSGFGQAVSAGWTAGEGFLGGVQGAFKAGAGTLSAGISSLFASGSGTMVNGVYQLSASAAPATVDLISNTVTNSSTGAVTGTASGATTAASAGLSASSAVMYGIGGAIQGYLKAGVKGAVAGAGGAVAGAYAGAAIGSAVPIIGNVIGAAIGAVLGGMFGASLFGGDWITKDEGFQLGVTDGELESNSFEYQKKKGGLFSSNKKRTRLTAMDPEMQAALDNTYAATLGTVIGLFDSLDVELNDAVLDGLSVAATQISTRDKTAEQIQEELSKWFTGLGDAAVAEVNKVTGSGLDGFNLEGLTAFVNNLYSVNASFDMIGVKMVDFNIAGGRAVENLVALAGGIDALNENMTKFYDGFTTDTQKSIDTLDGVRAQFAAMGLTLPGTRAAFAEAVKGLDMTSAAERQIFNSMTANAEQAAAAYTILEQRQSGYYSAFFSESENTARSITDLTSQIKAMGVELPGTRSAFRGMVEAAAQDTSAEGKVLYESLMNVAGLAGQAFDAIEQQATTATQALFDSLVGAATSGQSAVQRAIDAEQKATTAAYNARVTSLNDMSSTASKSVSELSSVSSSLGNALKSLRGDSDQAVQMLRTQAQATLQSALATVKAGGSLSGVSGLDDALSAVSSNTTDLYSSLEDFNRDQGRTANVVAELNALNGKQLTSAEQTVKTLKDQLDQAKLDYDAQIAQYQAQADFAQAQIDALNGVDTSVMSVVDAVNAMNAAVVAALAVVKPSNSTNTGTLIDSVYQDLLGKNADAPGKEYWQGQVGNGSISLDQLAGAVKNAATENAIKAAYQSLLDRDADAAGAQYWAGQVASGALTIGQLPQAIANAAKANGAAVKVPGYASGGDFGGGLRLVGENGPELEVTGPSRIFNANQTAAMLKGGGDSGVTAAEVKALRREVESNATYMAQLNKRIADGIDTLVNSGVQIVGTVDTKTVAA